jgi:tetratricopeptide (TPR) repeat protein
LDVNFARLAEIAAAKARVSDAVQRKDYVAVVAIMDAEISKSSGELFRTWRANCYAMRGAAWNRLEQFKQARSDLTEAITLNPSDAWYYKLRAETYIALKMPKNAIDDLSSAISREPGDAEMHLTRALLLGLTGQHREAMVDANILVRLKPGASGSWYFRGLILERLGHYREALEDYRRALVLDPLSKEARAGVGRATLALSGRRTPQPNLPRPDLKAPTIQL